MKNKPYRFEFKFYISDNVANEIRRVVKKYLQVDKNAILEHGAYPVTSLYFDSFKFTDYWEKTSGNVKRKKIRLRLYEPFLKDSKMVNLEIKHKFDMTNRKTKIRMSKVNAEDFVEQGTKFLLRNRDIDWRGQRSRILYFLIKENVKPSLFVTYNRQAFMSPDKNWRITFDSKIRCCKQNNLEKPKLLNDVHKGKTIIEFKYQFAIPFWFCDIIKKYNLKRDTFSKYEKSLEELNKFCPMLR